MRQPGMKHEGFGFAEGIDHPVQETHEEGGVEIHRARGIKQHDEPQRLDLTPPPGEVDRRAAVADIAVDGAAQVESTSMPAHLLAPHQPCTHRAREPRRQRVRACDIGGIGDVAQIGGEEVVDAGGAFAPAASFGRAFVAAKTLHVIGLARGALRGACVGQAPRWRLAIGAPGQALGAARAAPAPERLKDLIEFFPVRMGRAEQRAQCRLE